MTFRKRTWLLVIAVTLVATVAAAWERANVTAAALFCVALFAAWQSRKLVSDAGDLNDWLIALEGKDPFNPDVTPTYEWQGFVTTFVIVLRVTEHPTLSGKTLFLFRDEVDDDTWRRLVTRVRHGAHTLALNRKRFLWF